MTAPPALAAVAVAADPVSAAGVASDLEHPESARLSETAPASE
jgi:hypothetical protein